MVANAQYPATPKQLSFIRSLARERQVPVAGRDAREVVVIERIMDVLGEKDVSKGEASDAITYLLSRPRVAALGEWPDLSDIPPSKYMITGADGDPVQVEIVERRGGRRYLNHLIGAPGTWRRERVSAANSRAWAEKIRGAALQDGSRLLHGPEAAAVRFSREHVVCAACMSPLSDAESIARGLGPVCAGRF